jgi:ABC-type uncharacterized transport system auxiliary subunit
MAYDAKKEAVARAAYEAQKAEKARWAGAEMKSHMAEIARDFETHNMTRRVTVPSTPLWCDYSTRYADND